MRRIPVLILVLLALAIPAPGIAAQVAPQPPSAMVSAFLTPDPARVIALDALLAKGRAGDLDAAIVDPIQGWVTAIATGGASTWASEIPDSGRPSAQEASAALRDSGVLLLPPPAPVASSGGGTGTPLWIPFLVAGLLTLSIIIIAAANRRRGGGTRIGGEGQDSGSPVPGRKARRSAPISTVRFGDVAGCEEAVEELGEVVQFLRDPARFDRVGARMPRGVILHGPPGTGKTLLAKAVAGEAGVPFFAASGSDFVEMYVGVGSKRVRALFAEAAKSKSGAVIFLDEIDAIGKARGGGGGSGADSEREQTLNQLLVSMDGFGTSARVVVIAATNRLDMLDKALLRPGRFDRHVQVPLPAERGRRAILELHAAGKPLATDADLGRLAGVTAGMSGADLANVLNEAAIMAARDGRDEITQMDLSEGHLRAIAGAERRDSPLAIGEREVIAYHEAGHCLAAEMCPTHVETQRVSIRARGRAAGLALYGQTDRSLHSPQDLHERMVVALAGRAAEELVMGQISSGAANDLEVVNDIARAAVGQLGFSTALGQLRSHTTHGTSQVSDETQRRIDDEVARMVTEAYRDALSLLDGNRDALDALAAALLEHDELLREDIDMILGAQAPRVRPRLVAARLRPSSSEPAPILPAPRPSRLRVGSVAARAGALLSLRPWRRRAR